MFNPFVQLDDVLLGAAQKFCDKFQRLTGFTKFRLQKWMLVFSMISCWLGVASLGFNPTTVVSGLMNTAVLSLNVWLDEKAEAEFLANGHPRYSASNSIFLRLVILCLSVVFGILALSLGGVGKVAFCQVMFFVAWVYFSVCIPRPPSKSKMRQWYEKGLWWLHDQLKPEPVPVRIPVPGR